jgi:thiol:disulfide interchange protein DsbC
MPKISLQSKKKGSEPIIEQCEDHPVRKHFNLGQRIGITGTPAIVTSDGRLLPGYLPADELLLRIEGSE